MSHLIYKEADRINKVHHSLFAKVEAIQKFINDNLKSSNNIHLPKDIIESRFTAPEEAYDKSFRSCGVIANISSAMLRHMGYKVKLIHGECAESVDHAWVNVYDESNNRWTQFDLTRENIDVPKTHFIKNEIDSWEDIKDQIEEDSRTLAERRKFKNENEH